MAHGAKPASRRRESREHPPTLGRTGRLLLGLSTGAERQSEEEDELDELDAVVPLEDFDDDESDEDFESEDEPEVEAVAGVVDVDAARLSVR